MPSGSSVYWKPGFSSKTRPAQITPRILLLRNAWPITSPHAFRNSALLGQALPSGWVGVRQAGVGRAGSGRGSLLTVKEVAARLGVTRWYVATLIDCGRLQAYDFAKPGHRAMSRVPEEAVEAFLSDSQTNH